MSNIFLTPFSLPIIMLFSYKEVSRVIPSTIEGVVVEEGSGLPVEKAHIYIVKGEEEAITGSKGSFRILTWKKFPVNVVSEHAQYEARTTTLAGPGDKFIIRLKRK